MLDVIRWLKKLKDAINQMSNLIYSHAGRHKPGGVDALFPADFNLEPASDNAYDIGKETLRWRNGHFSQWLYAGYQVVPQDPIYLETFDEDHSSDWEITNTSVLQVTWDTTNKRLILTNPSSSNGYAVYKYIGRKFTWVNAQII
ncbi:MAG: hypothetical protein J7K71_03055, partial [Candidatus Omnitrophica bacterium]|nr:hypothetical protein [Candidatus Omnitrophota bacterium]